ncbi:MAG: hypothetical protein ACR2K3_06115 [Nocardioides sp.]
MYEFHDDFWPAPQTSTVLDRLTHLVLVDGRLVDVWSEPVVGTRWAYHAETLDRQVRPQPPPPPPMPEQVLTWLDAAVGGRSALVALDDGPPADEDLDHDPALPAEAREHLATVVDLLELGARHLRDRDAWAVLHRALATVLALEPDAVLRHDPERVAGGLCWLVGKANGLFGPSGCTTQAEVKQAIGCPVALSVTGRTFERAVAGFWPRPHRPSYPVPDLLLLGRGDLLTRATRRRLMRLREQTLSDAETAEAPILP